MSHRPLPLLAVCAALGVSALASPRPAHAQGAPPPAAQPGPSPAQSAAADAAALAKSREMFQQANSLYDAGKYPQAEALYQQAWKLRKSYDLAANFGNLEADMNKPRAAAEYISYAIREFPAGGKPALRDALIKRLAEVSKFVGVLRITVNKPGADVVVDGQVVGTSPLAGEVYVDPGPHSVEARLEGFPPALANVEVQKGKSADVTVALVPPPGANKAVIAAGASVAGVGVIVGGVLMGISASKGSTASNLQGQLKSTGCPADQSKATGMCGDLRDALNSKATLGNAGLWMLVGGGVVGVGTLIYGLAGGGSSKPSKTGIQVVPVTTGDGGGLLVQGTF